MDSLANIQEQAIIATFEESEMDREKGCYGVQILEATTWTS